MNNYCVYFYLREDGSPYYVGMGRKQRPFARHAHREGKGDFKPNDRDLIFIAHENLSQQEAYDLEIMYIKEYGRKCDGGILINLTEGGQGALHNEETRKKLSLIKTGTKASEETKRKMSEAHKGKIRSLEAIAKTIETRKADGSYVHTEETKKKLSESLKGIFAGSKNPAARAIVAFDKNGTFIGQFETAREAAEKLNIGNCWKHIPAVCKGQRKHTCGYIFQYVGEENK
jgi:hypothetical protein